MEQSLELFKNLKISKRDYIIVGCSGGPDSMCLLHLLHTNGYKVVCAHVNHNMREESDEEYDFVSKYCEKNKISFEGKKLEKENKNENYYRKKRYNFYKELANKYNTKYIATAHHGDDLIETILMRIMRGSNLKGYLGFSKVFKEKEFVMLKPLIFYTKEDIIKYNKENKIKYYNDKTNDEDKYTRNRYRHNVLPFLKSENPQVHKKFLKFSEELEKAKEYINRVVIKAIDSNYDDYSINLENFTKLDGYIQKCELELILSQIYGDDIDKIHTRHIEKILSELKKNKNFKLSLPNLTVSREYNSLRFITSEENSEYRYELKEYNKLENEDVIEIVNKSSDTSNYTLRLNSKDVKLPLYIRTRCNGDKIEVKNLNGSTKIKKVFIDNKVEPSLRDTWPIVVDRENNVIWLPGLKKSKFDNEISQKYDIILKYVKKGKDL